MPTNKHKLIRSLIVIITAAVLRVQLYGASEYSCSRDFEKKKKADLERGAEYFREEREKNFSDPSTIATYVAWIAGGVGFAYFKNVIAAPKYASGEWQDIHITLPTPSFLEKAAETAVDAGVVDTAAADVVQTVVDSASSAL